MDTMTGGFCFVPWKIIDDPELTPHDKAVYLTRCRFSDRERTCYPSISTISIKSKTCTAQVKKSLSILESRGYVIRERRHGERGNESTMYRLYPTSPPDGRPPYRQGRPPCSQPLAIIWPTLGHQVATKKNHITITKEQEKRGEEDLVVPRESATNQEKAPILAVVELHHRMLPGLPAVRLLSSKRRRAMGSLISADGAREDLGGREFFNAVYRFPGLLGESSRGWTADLDWLLAGRRGPGYSVAPCLRAAAHAPTRRGPHGKDPAGKAIGGGAAGLSPRRDG